MWVLSLFLKHWMLRKLFILSVDAPFVEQRYYREDFETGIKVRIDIIVAQSPSGVQPLCGLYKKSILPLAYAQLEKETISYMIYCDLAHTLFVQFDEDEPFTNLNHPEEYQKALKRF